MITGGEGSSLQAAGDSLPSAVQEAVDLLDCKGTLLAHVQPGAHQDPQGHLCRAAFQTFDPQSEPMSGLFLSKRRASNFLLLNFMRFLLAYVSGLSRSARQHNALGHQPLLLTLNCEILLSVYSVLSSRSFLRQELLSVPLCEQRISHGVAEQSPGRQTESAGWCRDHQCVACRQTAVWATRGNSWEWSRMCGGLGLRGKQDTLPELLKDHQSQVLVADKKATKDFQDNLAVNQFTGFQLVFSLWTKVSGWMPNDSE